MHCKAGIRLAGYQGTQGQASLGVQAVATPQGTACLRLAMMASLTPLYAGCAGFFTMSQCRHWPPAYAQSRRFDTMPSRPMLWRSTVEGSYEAEQIASLLKSALPRLKFGSLRLWGEGFGGRIRERHKIVDCDARDLALHMHFNEGESLYVWSPQQAELHRQMFKIQNVARVRLEWFRHGRPRPTKTGAL